MTTTTRKTQASPCLETSILNATADAVLDGGIFAKFHPKPFSEAEREAFRHLYRGAFYILLKKFRKDPSRLTTDSITAAMQQVAARDWGYKGTGVPA